MAEDHRHSSRVAVFVESKNGTVLNLKNSLPVHLAAILFWHLYCKALISSPDCTLQTHSALGSSGYE